VFEFWIISLISIISPRLDFFIDIYGKLTVIISKTAISPKWLTAIKLAVKMQNPICIILQPFFRLPILD